MSEWREVTVGEIALFSYGRGLPESERQPSGGVPVYGSNGIVGYHSEPLTNGPTIIIGRKGSIGTVQYSPSPCWPIDTTFYVVGKDADTVRFLYYALKSIGLEHLNTDSAVPGLNRDNAHAQRLLIPTSEKEQRAIARILGALDDKIELNRRMNATLEQIARALFKAWFVDFEPIRAKQDGRWRRGESLPGLPAHLYDLFPDRLVDSELGAIPEGWKVAKIGDIASVDKGLSYKGEGLTNEGGLPLVNLGCFGGNGVFKVENLKRYSGQYRERHLVYAGDLVMANTDITQNRSVLGSPALVPELNGERQFLFTHHTFALRFHTDTESWRRYVYYMLLQPRFREIAESYATGTTVLALPKEAVLEYSILLPSENLRNEFEQIVESISGRINVNLHQSRTLAALRDTLLPQLITGVLRVRDVEKVLEGHD